MWCVKCGKEIADGSAFCPICGADLREVKQEANETEVVVEAAAVEAPVYAFFRRAFSGNLFLAACILVTVFAAGGLFNFSLDVVLDILCAVAFWLLRQSVLNNNVMAYKTPLKILHVSSVINWVVLWVAVGLMALGGLVMLIFGSAFTSQLGVEFLDFEGLPAGFVGMGATIIAIVFIICAVAFALLNIYCFGNFKKCAKSFVTSIETENLAIEKFEVVKAWLLVNAILETLSIFDGNWAARIVAAASAAFFYVLFFWAKDLTKDQQI